MIYDIVNIHGCDLLVFACKSLSDWIRYLVLVPYTGKSGIFRGQPASLRGSDSDYSGRGASNVKDHTHKDRL